MSVNNISGKKYAEAGSISLLSVIATFVTGTDRDLSTVLTIN